MIYRIVMSILLVAILAVVAVIKADGGGETTVAPVTTGTPAADEARFKGLNINSN